MLTNVRLRSASQSDWPQISALLVQCRLRTEDLFASVESFQVALSDGRIVGCAAAEQHGTSIVIRSVAVDPDYRDRGIASQLTDALLMHARGTEVRHALLVSASAPAYFARWGFSHIPFDEAPAEVRGSAEFRNAAHGSALCMHCDLR